MRLNKETGKIVPLFGYLPVLYLLKKIAPLCKKEKSEPPLILFL